MNSTGVCAAEGCPTTVPRDDLMCDIHWPLVPASLKSSISASRRAGPPAHSQHQALVAAAIAEVAHKQARNRFSRTTLPARQPVQLALFEPDIVQAPAVLEHLTDPTNIDRKVL